MANARRGIPVPLPLVDAALAIATAFIASAIRLDPAGAFGAYLPITLALALASSILLPTVFSLFGIYRIYWPYATWAVIFRTLAATLASTVASAVILWFLTSLLWPHSFPRSMIALQFLLLLPGLAGIRIIKRIRLLRQGAHGV